MFGLGLGRLGLAGGGCSAWTPEAISAKLKAWYEPGDLTTNFQDSAGSTPATVDQQVGRLLDKSGLGNHVIQATAGNRPYLRIDGNGNYYLEFDGVNDFLRATFAMSQPWDRVSALRQISWTANDRVIAGAAAYYVGELTQRTPSPGISFYDGGTALVIGSGAVIGVNAVVTEKHNGASSRGSINTLDYIAGNAGASAPDGITIGGADSALGAEFNANIRLYGLVMAEGLTDGEVILLRDYLARKANGAGSIFRATTDYATVNGVRRYSYQSSYVDSSADSSYANALDVLLPDTYDAGNTYPLIVVLGVEPYTSSYADEMQVIQAAGLHNTHNAIFCRVNTRTSPWWGAKADGTVDYEKLVRDGLVPWMRANFPIVASRQGVSLLGYSKGGWGAYSLILRNPAAFGYAACWDAPLTSSYASMSSSGADVAIGSSAQWALYSPSAILAANVASVNDKTRLVLTGYNLFNTEVTAFASLLTSNSVAYTYDSTSRASHNANSGWMSGTVGALAALW